MYRIEDDLSSGTYLIQCQGIRHQNPAQETTMIEEKWPPPGPLLVGGANGKGKKGEKKENKSAGRGGRDGRGAKRGHRKAGKEAKWRMNQDDD